MEYQILIADGLSAEGLSLLKREAEVVQGADLEQLSEFDALIVRSRTKATAEVIASGAPRLRVIGRAGVGVDNIDLAAAREHHVTVVNTPHAPTIAAAELTVGLMFALARQIPGADRSLRMGEWRKSDFVGFELFGKTLGIIGMGNIGSAVAQRAKALGMQILGYDPNLDRGTIADRGAEPVNLDHLLGTSDMITLHVPLTPETRGLIGQSAFSVIKPGIRLISTSRGGVVDELALLENLNSGTVAGAALDVFEKEPATFTELLQHPNMICTPHIGAQTREAQARTSVDIAEEVLAALRGERLRWQVH